MLYLRFDKVETGFTTDVTKQTTQRKLAKQVSGENDSSLKCGEQEAPFLVDSGKY